MKSLVVEIIVLLIGASVVSGKGAKETFAFADFAACGIGAFQGEKKIMDIVVFYETGTSGIETPTTGSLTTTII